MADRYTVIGVAMDEPICTDPMGKDLGKQAAIVLAYTICQYTHDTVGIIKNDETVIFFVEHDEMTGKPYLVPMVEESVTAHITQTQEAYSVYFQGFIDVREYVNLHDGLCWDKDSFQKYHHSTVRVDNRAALDGFVEFLTKAKVTVKWHEKGDGNNVQE